MLEEGIIDGALVTRMNKRNPLEPDVIIARSREEIVASSKSKYCPVPANIGIKKMLKKDEKFAVVGLPCHLHGVRKAEMLNRKLKEKIVLHLGLFCSHTSNFLGTEYLLKMINVRKQDVTKIEYRGKGWPGFMTVRLVSGNEVSVPMNKWYVIVGSRFFCPVRCMLCSDATSELSDISFGDAWLPELRNNHTGVSMVISRSRKGQKILEDAQSKGKIHIVKIDRDKVLESQKDILNFKKKSLAARLFLWRLADKSIPSHNSEFLRPGITSYVSSFLWYLAMSISLRPCLLQHLFFNQGLFLKNKIHEIYRGILET
jgi:coenzyme F420 hydrogenase subunit beta